MKNIVIAGSASLQDEISFWKKHWENHNFCVLNYPCAIEKENFLNKYPTVHKKFFEDIKNTDILFVMNENKKGIKGYIGAETFAEICFAVAENLIYKKNIKILLLQTPDKTIQSYDEISLWLELGWIELYKNK